MVVKKNREYCNSKIWGLEIFRFLLVWMTFLFHAWGSGISFKQMDLFISNGAIAMEGFFMLSGFVAYLNYRNTDFSDPKTLLNFYKGKAVRLMPLAIFKLAGIKVIWHDFSAGGY